MGTCRLLDELVAQGGHGVFDITVYGEEPGGAYNRILLNRVLSGDSVDAIVTKPPDWYDRRGIRLLSDTRVRSLDTLQKHIETDDGHRRRYDLAVIATGSEPIVPALEGLCDPHGRLRPGAFVYRTASDCLRMREHTRLGDSVVVIGGGLLGLEAAKTLSDRGLYVTVVHLASTLMNAQLDRIGGEMLSREIERAGIFVRTGKTVTAIHGTNRIEGVLLDDGSRIPTEMVVLACGVRPRTDVARASGLPVNRGIVVNDALATPVPSVYALGECAEHRGSTYGIVSPVWEQAAVLAGVLCARQPQPRYRGSKLYTRLKVAGIDVASMGCIEPELQSDDVLQIVEERRNAYRKLIMRDGYVLGAIFVGDAAAAASVVQLYDRDDPLPGDPLEALCEFRGGTSTADRMVCNCHKVSEFTLRDAIASGADSVEALGAATRAGTNCGSCKSDIALLLARSERASPLSL